MRHASLTVDPDPAALGRVRSWLRDEAGLAEALAADAVADLVLAVHEVVANVTEHARPTSPITIVVRWDARGVLVRVEDDGAPPPAALPTPRRGQQPDAATSERGRGLRLVEDAVTSVRHERAGERNRWELWLERPGEVVGAGTRVRGQGPPGWSGSPGVRTL